MKALVIAFNAHKHLFGFGDRRFFDRYGLKAALERGVLFNILAVLLKGGSTYNLNFTAGKRGL